VRKCSFRFRRGVASKRAADCSVTTDRPTVPLSIHHSAPRRRSRWRGDGDNLFANHQSKRLRQTAARRYRCGYEPRAAPSTCRLDAGGPDGSRRRPSRVLDMSITPTSTCRYISPSSLGKRKPTGHDQQRSTSDARPTPFRLKKYYAQLPGRNEYRATLSMSM